MSAPPAVSVVTPVWNAEGTLGEAVASLRAQTRGDWEMLLVDDGSTDGSRALAERLAAGEPRIRLLGWPDNRGAAAARNAGIRAARGRFIAFLDADDLWWPQKLAVQIGYMEATGAPFTFAAVRPDRRRGPPLGRGARPRPGRPRAAAARQRHPLPDGRLRPGALRGGGDAAPRAPAGLRALAAAARAGRRGARPAAGARRLPGAAGLASSDKLTAAAATWRVYREVAGLGRARAAWRLGGNLARGALKRLG
jgi:glycosyltransferase involved in cell wall biosynthesis